MGYWDTSCLVKLYVDEADADDFRAHAENDAKIVTGEITRMELWATFLRKEFEGDLLEGGARERLETFDHDVGSGLITVLAKDDTLEVEFESVIERCYDADPPIFLKTLDAIHVASARLSTEAVVVTKDRRMRQAVLLLGLQVFPAEPLASPTPPS